MKIALCDDENEFLVELESQLKRYSKEKNIQIQIDSFESGSKFLNHYTEHKDYNIIFLDIQMPGIDGIELAQILRKRNDKITIIFLTSLLQYALDGYRVGATRYLLKPLSYKKLCHELDEVFKSIKDVSHQFFIVKNDYGFYKIMFHEVSFIETYKRNALVHLEEQEIISYKTLKYYEQLLDSRFFRCHSGYLVNIEKIKKVEKFNIELLNGDIIPLSKNRKHNFSQELAKYYGSLI